MANNNILVIEDDKEINHLLCQSLRSNGYLSKSAYTGIHGLEMLKNEEFEILIPAYTVGLATRDIVLLEFSNSILCLILAGKVGSNIASEIGTMRVTEQIDALEIMGVNSANYLVLPKIIAFVGFMPVLGVLCIATAFVGGWLVAQFTDIITVSRYVYGLQALFQEWYVWYGLIKSLVFAFIISTVASFFGYYVKGGALDVGKASTNGVVSSSILILLFDVILTKLLLQ